MAYEAQPGAQAPMDAHLAQSQQYAGEQGGTWKHGLFDCFEDPVNCVVGCFVPCLILGATSERMDNPSNQHPELINNHCLIHGGLNFIAGCGWVYAMLKRMEMRKAFGIPGSDVEDCLTAYCCQCCAIIQQDSEAKARLGHPNVTVVQQYQNKEAMVAEPQVQPQAQPQQ